MSSNYTSDNFVTLPIQQNLPALATSNAEQAIAQTGRALPCKVLAVNGSLVQVSFEVQGPFTLPPLWLPKAESQWARMPTQVGDVGITVPADTFLGGISGQGSGVADMTREYGNMSTLVFVPVAATGFSSSPNANQAWLNGPAGARISDAAQTATVEASANEVQLIVGSASLALTASGLTITIGGLTWTFTASGLTMSSGIVAETHVHGGVTTGSADTGTPLA